MAPPAHKTAPVLQDGKQPRNDGPFAEANSDKAVEGIGAPGADDSTAGFANRLSYQDMNSKYDVEYKLPITGSRTATWRASAFHNITAMVGAGVLNLPQDMTFLGWPGGTVTLVLSWIISLYTLHQLVALHEVNGRRFNRYHELGQYAFGPKLGLWIVIPAQLIVMIGLGLAYSITGGEVLQNFWHLVCQKNAAGGCSTAFGLSAWIIVYSGVQFFLIQCPNFNALRIVSLSAAVMSLGYSTIAIGTSISQGRQPDAEYNLDGFNHADGVFGIMNALGSVAFAYGGHNVVLEIQATMPGYADGNARGTKRDMMKGVYVAYAVVAWCYFGVAFAGYHAFGNKVMSNVIFSVGHPKWVVGMADLMILVHVLGSYQVYTMPVLDMIETQFVKRGINATTRPFRLVYRSIYVVLTCFISCTIPFWGDLLGFIGALGTGPTTFWYPSVIWLVIKRPGYKRWDFWASWVCIVLGVMVTVVGSVAGLRGIIVDASSYHFYQ